MLTSVLLPSEARRFTVGELIHSAVARVAADDPDRLCAGFIEGRTRSYGEMWDEAQRVAAGLRRLGVSNGHRVAIFLSNREEFLTTWLGISACGAVSVPVNIALKGDVLRYMFSQTTPDIVVTEAAFESSLSPVLASGATRVISVDGGFGEGALGFAELVEGSAAFTSPDIKDTDLASIMYTSGTTGPSKGVMWSHRTAISLAENATFALGYTRDDVSFSALPLFHGNALGITFLPTTRVGGRTAFATWFSAADFWKQCRDTDATVTSLLGTMAPILWNRPPDESDRSHRLRISLAAPKPTSYLDAFEERFGLTLTQVYGLTDVGLPICTPYGEVGPVGSCGKEHPDWKCALVDENDDVVPLGDPGELVGRPRRPFITALGYWQMPEATVEAWRNLWFHTGDLLRQDDEGWFYFVDRRKDAIRRAGENVSAFEVENRLLSNPDVQEAAVVAVDNELSEQDIMAVIVLEPGVRFDPDALWEYCDQGLPYFAVPRYLRVVESLPKTETGKVQKAMLRATGKDASTWDAGVRGRKYRRSGAVR